MSSLALNVTSLRYPAYFLEKKRDGNNYRADLLDLFEKKLKKHLKKLKRMILYHFNLIYDLEMEKK